MSVTDTNAEQPRREHKDFVVQLGVDELEKLVRGVIQQELQALGKLSAPSHPSAATGEELEPLLSASEVATILKCGVRTLKRWLADGVAPPPLATPGSRLRWRRSAVRKWLDDQGLAHEGATGIEKLGG